jgi:uncharacterized protein YidB (DUF937 family)
LLGSDPKEDFNVATISPRQRGLSRSDSNRFRPLDVIALLETWRNDMALLGALRSGRRLPLMKILMSVLAYRSITRGNGRIAALIGARMGRAGGLGGLLAGGAGGAFLSAVLRHMLDNTSRGGAMTPQDIERALGEERISWLMTQTGMSRKELLKGLSGASRENG